MPGSAFELYLSSTQINGNSHLSNGTSTSSIDESLLNATVSFEQSILNTTATMTSELSVFYSVKNRFFLSQTQSYVSILMLLSGTALSRFGKIKKYF
jgi:hypothetical protein